MLRNTRCLLSEHLSKISIGVSEQVTFISGVSIMNKIKEGGFITCPPILDGTNYSYWKARMTTFFESIDSKFWKVVVTRWSHPTMKGDDGKEILKPKVQGCEAEDEVSLGNS